MPPVVPSIPPSLIAREYFDMESFLKRDIALGVTRSRGGTRYITLTSDFLRGLHRALNEEAGEAWYFILYRCGLHWGNRMAERLDRDFTNHFNMSTHQLDMRLFIALIETYFTSNGWGRLRLDLRHVNHGIIEAELENPLYASLVGRSERGVEALVAGQLGAIFSHFSKAELLCHQTECVALGDPVARFIISDAKRLDPVPDWAEERVTHEEILGRLMGVAAEA